MSLLLRALIGLVGVGIVGAAAHSNIIATGGYGQPAAIVTIALAAGVAIGAIAIGLATSGGRWLLSVIICIALLCGEAYNLLNSAEQVITSRDAAQAPLRDAIKKHDAAVQAVSDAKARADRASASRPDTNRVIAAKAALDAANAAVRDQASLPGCRTNCRELLQAQVAGARQELDAAMIASDASADADRQKAAAALDAAQRALAAAPLPGSATPLADRLGVPAWLLDILMASLKSVGVNLLGAALIAVAAHGPKQRKQASAKVAGDIEAAKPAKLVAQRLKPAAVPADNGNVVALPPPAGRVAKFLLDALEHQQGERVDIVEFYTSYRSWCGAQKLTALKPEAFNDELAEALDIADIETRKVRGKLYLIDVAFQEQMSVAS